MGRGEDAVWFYKARGDTRSRVIFLHGYGGRTEETPANHVAWLKHLAEQGSDVIYPRYEIGGEVYPYPHIDTARAAALDRLGRPDVPTIVIGYSRGGWIAVDYAAYSAARGREPKLVVAVFPALHTPFDRLARLRSLDAKTRIVIMVGDQDTGVGGTGAQGLLVRLRRAGFPGARVTLRYVESTETFSATHLSVLESSDGARAAFWKPVDAMIAAVR